MICRNEDGMTMVEVVVAAFIMVLGGLAVLGLVDATSRTTYRAEQGQVNSNLLQDELERIKDLPFSQIALTGVPAGSGDQSSPASRVQGTNYNVARQGTAFMPLVYNGGALEGGGTVSGGAASSAPTSYQSGDVGGAVHRFVVWENDDSCAEALCPGSQDFKRIIVAATFNPSGSGGTRIYQEIQARVANPEAEPVDNPGPPPGDQDPTPWTFFLTDTPCNNTDRQPITSDHLTHNTRGACSAGLKTGNTPGAPDLMLPEAPPLPPEEPLYDYGTDVEPAQDPTLDKGLTVVRPGGVLEDGCLTQSLLDPFTNILGALIGDLDATKFQKVHKWVTPAIPSGLNVELLGTGSLDLWTKTVNGASHPGKLCIWLFHRQLNVLGVPIDTPVVNLALNLTYFTYEQQSWPTDWSEIHIPLDFLADLHLLPGHRLGLAVAVERQGTMPGSGIEFIYDTPSFDSRISVETNSLLPW